MRKITIANANLNCEKANAKKTGFKRYNKGNQEEEFLKTNNPNENIHKKVINPKKTFTGISKKL